MSFYLNINVNGVMQDNPEVDALLEELCVLLQRFDAVSDRIPGSVVRYRVLVDRGDVKIGLPDTEEIELPPAVMEDLISDIFAVQDARVKDEGKRCTCRLCTAGWAVRDAYDAGRITKLEAFGRMLKLKREAMAMKELPDAFLDQLRVSLDVMMAAQYN